MATAQPTVDASPKKGKSKKLLVILIAAVLALVAIGGGAVFYLKKKQAAEETEWAEEEDARPVKSRKRDPAAKPVFVTLELFTVNLADRDADRYAQVAISLELTDEKSSEMIKNHMPIIRNYILMTLSHKTASELMDRSGKVKLAQELRREIARALGLQVDEPPPPRKPAAENADAATDGEQDPPPRRRVRPEDLSPVLAVHFSNFIIQ
jgi:flagellar FliL protein